MIVAGASARTARPEARQRQIGRALKGWVHAAVCLVDQAERERRDEHDEDQGDLEHPVEAQGRPDPIGDPATDRRTDGHATEEAGQDRRHSLRRIPEDEDELA